MPVHLVTQRTPFNLREQTKLQHSNMIRRFGYMLGIRCSSLDKVAHEFSLKDLRYQWGLNSHFDFNRMNLELIQMALSRG